MTHGFNDYMTGDKVLFTKAWMETSAEDINVILFDWTDLAGIFQFEGGDDYAYNEAARNSVDLGEYLGHCLAALWELEGLSGANLHLAGHSLGSHLMGKAARVFKDLTGETVQRVTGLDPAGPRFVDGPLLDALPELNENRLGKDSADFVDIIHSDGSLSPALVWVQPALGDLHQIGHADFYPQVKCFAIKKYM